MHRSILPHKDTRDPAAVLSNLHYYRDVHHHHHQHWNMFAVFWHTLCAGSVSFILWRWFFIPEIQMKLLMKSWWVYFTPASGWQLNCKWHRSEMDVLDLISSQNSFTGNLPSSSIVQFRQPDSHIQQQHQPALFLWVILIYRWVITARHNVASVHYC